MSFLYSLITGRPSHKKRRLSITPGAGYAPIPEDPTEPRTPASLEQQITGVPPLGRGVKWVHFSLGAAVLLPWNAMITAMPYFLSRLEGSSLRSAFPSWLSTSFTAANFVVLAYATYTSDVAQSAIRIRLSTIAIILMFVLLTLSTLVPASPSGYFAFAIIMGMLLASAGSYTSNALVALASIFGPMAMQSVMSGQAAIGVLVSLVQLISAWLSLAGSGSTPAGAARSAFGFFGVGVIFLIGCLFSHGWLTSLRVYARAMEPWMNGTVGNNTPALQGEEGETTIGESVESTVTMGQKRDVRTLWKVARKNLTYNLAVGYVFIITLAVFPPITTSIHSVHDPTSSMLFNPLIFNALHFFMFNIGDWTGRHLCTYPVFLTWKARNLLVYSLSRTVFVPLFLMCNVEGFRAGTSPIINSDFLYMVILLFFGITNGHVSSNIMMAAPSIEHNKKLLREEIDTAATVASFCLMGGLLTGSILSFAVRGWICGCDPFIGG
ncbi:hypothetical protein CALCODRAFT_426720 [Calocera cornea HHB12733]|uniref:Nucleoside transporter n=1 Tax=Calocera cornea HHB12733 TaxID=1353952 RepID=A0A165JQS6_9BASI|nr:hypothetical protein CALCODRAFT_426720 [Calocera cornea HHB12733]